MTLRIGILPHADLPHLVPCFRIARELLKYGHTVHILGSDAFAIFRGHTDAWGDHLTNFGLRGQELTHRDPAVAFPDWLTQQLKELQLDLIILDAVWQGLVFPCHASGLVKHVVVHHAGLPDFRSADMPAWCFVHPGHPKDHWAQARAFVEQSERAGRGIRATLSTIKALSPAGRAVPDNYEFGCSELSALPAIHAMSLPPDAEFPNERGRVEYFGTLLPKPGDVDWRPPPAQLTADSQPLIACVFGTKGLQTKQEYEWLHSLAKTLGNSFPQYQVAVVIREDQSLATDLPKNVLTFPWIPLWELLSTRAGPKVLVSTPGVGAFREAIASATPIVAIPRRLDQFGAAARVEYFGIGAALVSPELPQPELVAQRIAQILIGPNIQPQSRRLRDQYIGFDATFPLKRFIEELFKNTK